MGHELPVKYSELVDQALQANIITKNNVIFNNNHEGKGEKIAGSVVKIPVRSTEIVVGDYDKAKGIDLNIGGTNYIDLKLEHDKAVNEMIDGYDAASVPDGILAERMTSAAYALALTIDTLSIRCLENEGTVLDDKEALTEETIYNKIVDMRTQLSDTNVPTAGRWLIVSAEVYGLLLKDTTNFIRQGELSEKLIQSGAIGQIAGFTVYESTILTKNNEEIVDGKTTSVEMIAGHSNWCHRVEAWSVPLYNENLTNQYVGAMAVKGRKVFGMKISKPETVLIKRKEI